MKGIYASILGALVAIAIVTVVPHAGETTAVAADDGKAVFLAAKCDMCHSVPSAEIAARAKIAKLKGPDLPSDSMPDAETIGPFLRRASEIDGTLHKKEFKGTDEELAAILAWLAEKKPAAP